MPAEFKELRKQWRKQKREREAMRQQHQHHQQESAAAAAAAAVAYAPTPAPPAASHHHQATVPSQPTSFLSHTEPTAAAVPSYLPWQPQHHGYSSDYAPLSIPGAHPF